MLVKAQICVDFAAGSQKSSSTTGRTTIGHVLAQSVAVEGLENEKKKVVGSATEAPKYVPDGHHRPRPTTKFVPEGNFFCSDNVPFTLKWWNVCIHVPSLYVGTPLSIGKHE